MVPGRVVLDRLRALPFSHRRRHLSLVAANDGPDGGCLTEEAHHARRLDQEAFAFLRTTSVSKKHPEATLWDRMMGYKKDYAEKKVLLDPAMAATVAEAIRTTSEADEKATTFIDGQGGCCEVTRRVLEAGTFSKAKIMHRDEKMKKLNQWALEHRLLDFRDRMLEDVPGDINRLPSHLLEVGNRYVSPLTEERLKIEKAGGWHSEQDRPPYTFFSLASVGTIVSLTRRRLNDQVVTSEFHGGLRPELYFLVSPHTTEMVMCSGGEKTSHHRKPMHMTCTLAFDVSLVLDSIPRSSFFPWRPLKSRIRTSQEEVFHLLRLRPKRDLGLAAELTGQHLEYLFFSVMRRQKTRVIPTMEHWADGVGVDLIRAGFGLYQTADELHMSDHVKLINILAAQPTFNLPAFEEKMHVYMEAFGKPRGSKALGSSEELENLVEEWRRTGKQPKRKRKKVKQTEE